MAPEDSRAPFLRIPWTARLINKPGIICRVPGSRAPKVDTEDSLLAEILKSPRTIRSCLSYYPKPASETDEATEVSTLMTIGDGMNGHPATIHGGITATLCDEAMGIFQAVNAERAHLAQVRLGKAEGELPPIGVTSYTAELKIRYLKPVQTPGALVVTARRVKKEGRKEWLRTELKQCQGFGEDDEGEVVTCAIGEALFIQPKGAKL